MFWRWLTIFVVFSFSYSLLFLMNFWHIRYGGPKEIFGIQLSSYWISLFFYILFLSPIIIGANYLFFSAYHYGYNIWRDVFCDKFWVIHLTNSASTIFTLLILTWIFFGECPSKGTLAGLVLAIAAVLVSIFWK